MRKPAEEEYLSGNLTAMIDVVFQLIIFFVCTVSMQEKAIDDRIRLALSPHGTAVTRKNPLEINIDVDSKGGISIARTPLSAEMLGAILKKAVGDYGNQNVPIIIRGHEDVKHYAVKAVLDQCTKAGVWKIKFAALKEKGT